MTSSDTAMWFSVGMSNVEEMTSPLMERSHVGDFLQDALVHEQARRLRTSGLFALMAAAMSLRMVVLPAFGG